MQLYQRERIGAFGQDLVKTIVTSAGYDYTQPDKDIGVDLFIQKRIEINGKLVPDGTNLKIQVKTTTKWDESEDEVKYDLKIDALENLLTHNDSPESRIKIILAVVLMNENNCLNVSYDNIMINQTVLWVYISGIETENTSSYRIAIPKDQLFCTNSLRDLVKRFSND